jgi:superfamily II DNA/RNA helicase
MTEGIEQAGMSARGQEMDIFETHGDITRDYREYIKSFIHIKDQRIREEVDKQLESGKLWPEPLIQFNPAFERAGGIDNLARRMSLHPGLTAAFKGYRLFRHQVDAIALGAQGRDFVVTSGTGSGKSLTYIASILHHLLSHPAPQGIQAVIVYPMNALINSQSDALGGVARSYEAGTGSPFPVRFAQYTGQEKQDRRDTIKENPHHILLTNYMMLELILTRLGEQSIRTAIFEHLRFLVFDELHTYRGRQGADVALLIRRILSQCANPVCCIGTSATMVSGGSLAEQKIRIAEVATTFFGKPIQSDQVITEKLIRSLGGASPPAGSELRAAILTAVPTTAGHDELSRHPVLAWLEQAIALREYDGDLVRHPPLQLGEICEELSKASGCSAQECRAHLQALLHRVSLVNAEATRAGRGTEVILPFKLHQFFAQTSSVYVTLDPPDRRTVTLDPNTRHVEEGAAIKPLFPVVFSRASGHEFVCVTLRPDGALIAREFRDMEDDEDAEEGEAERDGYLLTGEDVWSDDECESLPDAWVKQNRAGRYEPKSEKRDRFPRLVWFDESGHWSDRPQAGWQSGWFMSAPLLFDPTSGMEFSGQTREANKLTSLGMEGRSTSTTITCFSILDRLAEHHCDPEFQKLLSFTDNRQDAALQAGHFNDFIKVVQLRSAIGRAVAEAPAGELTLHTIGDAIFRALNLPLLDYANCATDSPLHAVRAAHEDTFRKFLVQRAFYDLRRSWRIVLPNLEQCALLKVDYLHLDELAALPWQEIPEMAALGTLKRRELLHTILDAFRLGYALSSRNYLDEPVLRELESAVTERLKTPWGLEHDEKLMRPYAFCLEGPAPRAHPYVKHIGPASLLGKFVIQYLRDQTGTRLDHQGYRDFMRRLLAALQDSCLESRALSSGKAGSSRLYWLKADAILWKPGDGTTALVDRLKNRSYKGLANARPNVFFQRLYRYDFRTRKVLRGDEHTGQLNNDIRQEREDLFKKGEISALFCSPTMELGIDIKLLSIVHMRNVPPNPANYAQRAGRAGRNGQAALVFNFCSSYSPHDRHYFREQRSLVAGTVTPPRLDLCNEELLRSHLHAMVLAEVGLATLGDERTSSLFSLVDATDENLLPLRTDIVERLRLSPTQVARIRNRFLSVVQSFRSDLDRQAGHWFSETWVDTSLHQVPVSLDDAMERWRQLYRNARRLNAEASALLAGGTLHPRSEEYRKAEREQRLAHIQLSQLKNAPQSGMGNQLSEFYPYRYLAAEAFLPGYNFTRLPLRVFIETQEGGGEFLSRPRTIALREYGPLNTIYHCGRKYQVNQLTAQSIEASLFGGAISRKAGYFLPPDQKTLEVCPFSGARLSEAGSKDLVNDLLEMGESRAVPKHRITCEEEERLARGYDLRTYFTVDAGHMDRIRRATLRSAGEPLLNLRFIPAARMREINFGWRTHSTGEGFPIVTSTGFWKGKVPEPKPDDPQPPPPIRLVKLTTSDTADALYIEPMKALGLDANGVLTLQYALLRGVGQVFQVEPSEIGSESLGQPEAPNILLYEASEGSLGVLTQFVSDPTVFRQVVEAATTILRYEDPSYAGPASYDDLLSYYNQRDHQRLDRFLIRDALARLLACQIDLHGARNDEDYETHYKRLCATLDPASSLERTFVDHLHERNLRLPDAAQKSVPELYCQPDFYYERNTWVFIDGSPHDRPEVRERDQEIRQRMRALGHDVLVYYYRDNLEEFVAGRPDVFKKVRG